MLNIVLMSNASVLSEPEVRRKFREAALQRALKEHTIRHKVDRLVSTVGELM